MSSSTRTGETAWDRSDERLKRMILKYRCLRTVAVLLGVRPTSLSDRLRRPRLAKWWKTTKAQLKRDNHAARVRKWRATSGARLKAVKALRLLDERPRPSTWGPEDVRLLVEVGALSVEQARALAVARADPAQLVAMDHTLTLDPAPFQRVRGR